jgi:hypothetical protein
MENRERLAEATSESNLQMSDVSEDTSIAAAKMPKLEK